MAEAPPVSGTVLARAVLGPSQGAENLVSGNEVLWPSAMCIARVGRARVGDSGSEGPSHARCVYGDLHHLQLGGEAWQLGFRGLRACPGAP
jgi:hypothetical protein